MQLANTALEQSRQRAKWALDMNRQEQLYSVGDRVLLSTANLNLPGNFSRKLAKLFDGPFIIKARIGDNAYELDLPHSVRLHPVFNVSQLRPYHDPLERFPGRVIDPQPPTVIDGEEEFEVEEVIRHHMFCRRREYLIKWKGYPLYPFAAVHPTSSDADSDVTSVRDASFPTGLHPLPTRTRLLGLNAISGVQPPRASAEPEPQPEPVRMAFPAGDPLAAEAMTQSPLRSGATWEDDPMAVEVAAGGVQMVSATPQPAATKEGAGEGVEVTGVPATSAHPLLPIRAASPAAEQPVAAAIMELEVLRAESPEAAPISPSPVEGPTVVMQEQAQAVVQPQTLVQPTTVEPMQQTVVVQVQPAAVVQEQPAAVVQVQPNSRASVAASSCNV